MHRLLLSFSIFLLTFFCLSLFSYDASGQNGASELDGKDFGYLKVESVKPDTFYVVINGDFENAYRIEHRDSLRLETGIVELKVLNPFHRDINIRTRISEGESRSYAFQFNRFKVENLDALKKYSSYPRIYYNARHVVVTDFDSEILINGESTGHGFATIDEGSGKYRADITIVPAGSGKQRSKTVNLEDGADFNSHELFIRPSKIRTRVYSFLPGASQLYKKDRLKGYSIIFSTLALAGGVYLFDSEMNRHNRLLQETQIEYNAASTQLRALELGNDLDHHSSRINRNYRLRNTAVTAISAVYLYSFIDGFFRTNDGYRRGLTIDPYLDFGEQSATISMSLNF